MEKVQQSTKKERERGGDRAFAIYYISTVRIGDILQGPVVIPRELEYRKVFWTGINKALYFVVVYGV